MLLSSLKEGEGSGTSFEFLSLDIVRSRGQSQDEARRKRFADDWNGSAFGGGRRAVEVVSAVGHWSKAAFSDALSAVRRWLWEDWLFSTPGP
jgi:hypothetical protein